MIPEFLSALLHMYENQKHYKGLCRNYLRLDGITCNMFRPVGFFNCANLAVCFVCPASFFSSWMCVCVGVVVVTFLSVAPPVSPPSSGHTPAAHQ